MVAEAKDYTIRIALSDEQVKYFEDTYFKNKDIFDKDKASFGMEITH
jgi:hypothetical protein